MKLLNVKKQRGFSLFDTMLAITVIAIVFIGVGALFLHAKSNSDVQNTITDIGSIVSTSTQMLNEDYSLKLNTQTLIDSGLLPSDLTDGTNLVGPLGAITVVYDADQRQKMTITAGIFDAAQARSICQQMVSTYYIDGFDTPSDCTSNAFAANTTLTFIYPKSAGG